MRGGCAWCLHLQLCREGETGAGDPLSVAAIGCVSGCGNHNSSLDVSKFLQEGSHSRTPKVSATDVSLTAYGWRPAQLIGSTALRIDGTENTAASWRGTSSRGEPEASAGNGDSTKALTNILPSDPLPPPSRADRR